MLFLLGSAIFVGFVHSLAPGHWLPVVILSKTRRWSLGTAALGAVIAASGHILISVVVASVAIGIGAELLVNYEEVIEKYAGLGLAVFGVAFAVFSFFRHSSCHGHEHHGPDPKQEKIRGLRTAIPFLLSIGFSPCIAVLPVFIAAAPSGVHAIAGTAVAFSIGVVAALVGSTLLVTLGLLKLDHPIFEHYGDVITGVAVAIMGTCFFLFGPAHLNHEHVHSHSQSDSHEIHDHETHDDDSHDHETHH